MAILLYSLSLCQYIYVTLLLRDYLSLYTVLYTETCICIKTPVLLLHCQDQSCLQAYKFCYLFSGDFLWQMDAAN